MIIFIIIMRARETEREILVFNPIIRLLINNKTTDVASYRISISILS